MLSLFKSCYSSLRSILTLDAPDTNRDLDLPPSIFDIAVSNNLKEVCLVEDSLSSFLRAVMEGNKLGIKVIFGYRVSFVSDATQKTEESFRTSHKNIIFPKNKKGYERLIRISTLAAYDNFHKEARLDYNQLHELWADDLALAVPFYDSFIHKNLIMNGLCIPDFRDIKPTFFVESNGLPFDYIIEQGVRDFLGCFPAEIERTKSIYYKNREDFEAYLTLKCLNRKAFGTGRTLDNPNFEHMGSREFCWESYLENKDYGART